jgi:hypothetical protein
VGHWRWVTEAFFRTIIPTYEGAALHPHFLAKVGDTVTC